MFGPEFDSFQKYKEGPFSPQAQFRTFFNLDPHSFLPALPCEQERELARTGRRDELKSQSWGKLFPIAESYSWLIEDCGFRWDDILAACGKAYISTVEDWDPYGESYFSTFLGTTVQNKIISLLVEQTESYPSVTWSVAKEYLVLKNAMRKWREERSEDLSIDPEVKLRREEIIYEFTDDLLTELREKLNLGLRKRRPLTSKSKEVQIILQDGISGFEKFEERIRRNISKFPEREQKEFMERLNYLTRLAPYIGNPKKIGELFSLFEEPLETLDSITETVEMPEILGKAMREPLETVLRQLPPREELVVRLRHGLGGRGLKAEEIVQEAERVVYLYYYGLGGRGLRAEEIVQEAEKEEAKFPEPYENVDLSLEITRLGIKGIREIEREFRDILQQRLVTSPRSLRVLTTLELYLLMVGEGLRDIDLGYAEIGEILDLSRNYIREIHKRALQRLREPYLRKYISSTA